MNEPRPEVYARCHVCREVKPVSMVVEGPLSMNEYSARHFCSLSCFYAWMETSLNDRAEGFSLDNFKSPAPPSGPFVVRDDSSEPGQ